MKSCLQDKEIDLNRVISKNEAEREILLEDLDRLSDQYQTLNMRFEEQGSQLAVAQVSASVVGYIFGFLFTAEYSNDKVLRWEHIKRLLQAV